MQPNHTIKMSLFSILLATVCVSTASAETIIVCGTAANMGVGAEVTVAQWLPGSDPLAPVVKRGHWRILHTKITGPFCPGFEVDMAQGKIYIKVKAADGSTVTNDQYGMYHLDTSSSPSYTGDYELYLDTVPNPDNNVYSSYKVPSVRMADGSIRQSPTIGMRLDTKWEESFPLRAGFEERAVAAGTSSIIID